MTQGGNRKVKVDYWDVVLDLPRTQAGRMEAVDNAYSLYEMVDGAIGACHVGRIFHPVLPGAGSGICRFSARRVTCSLGRAIPLPSSPTKRSYCPMWTPTAGITSLCAVTAARPNGRNRRRARPTTTTARPNTSWTVFLRTGNLWSMSIGVYTSPR